MNWELAEVTSPGLARPVSVVAAKGFPYVSNANPLQNLNIYLPRTSETSALIGSPVDALPTNSHFLVHIHGGAWRNVELTASSIEPTVAHLFATTDAPVPITAIASLNYSVSKTAVHPQHVSDVLHGFARLRSLGLSDQSYILSGHSCGACIALQAILKPPAYYGLDQLRDAPCPVALVGLNGLYDLPALVNGLGARHEHLRGDYESILSNAFGTDEGGWANASPASFDPIEIAGRVRSGKAPRLVVLDQSSEDQLVPMDQLQRLAATLHGVSGMRVVEGNRCTGAHAAPWEQGVMIVNTLGDVFRALSRKDQT